jgi:hypothetical protein
MRTFLLSVTALPLAFAGGVGEQASVMHTVARKREAASKSLFVILSSAPQKALD